MRIKMKAGLVLASLALAVASHPGRAQGAFSEPHERQPSLKGLVAQLKQAKTAQQATLLLMRIERCRHEGLKPVTSVLLRHAQRNLMKGAPREALKDMDSAITLQPDQFILWRERAQVKLTAGDLRGAMHDLRVAMAHDQNDVIAWDILTSIEEQSHRWAEAYAACKQLLKLSPKAAGAAKRLEYLKTKAQGQPV